jgi:hypothetical protein
MWVSRRQAQSAADAAALAGAVALAQDGTVASPTLLCPPGSTTPACLSARHWANNNSVFGVFNTDANVDVRLSGNTGATQNIPPCGTNPGCVRVDIMRNMPRDAAMGGQTLGPAIPTFFGPLIGINGQGVRATATAWVGAGNQVQCMVPFAVIDRWADNYDDKKDNTYFANDSITSPGEAGWTQNDDYQPLSGDLYSAPYNGNPDYNGWRVIGTTNHPSDKGTQLIIKAGTESDKGTNTYSSGWSMQVDLPASTGSSDYKWNIENCNKQLVGIAQASEPCLTVNEPIGCLSVKTGMAQGPTSQGISKDAESVYEQDPAAHWDPATQMVVGGQGMASPRIRPIAVIDMNHFISQNGSKDCSGTGCVAKVANIIGFFVEGMCKEVEDRGELSTGLVCPNPTKDVVGRIMALPGRFLGGAGTVETSAAFIQVIQLVR